MKTVIIASRRKGRQMWEGYIEVPKSQQVEELAYRRSMGRICKVFPDMNAYRANVSLILDRIEGGEIMYIYAEWTLYGVFDNGIFASWQEYYNATFNPDMDILVVRTIK